MNHRRPSLLFVALAALTGTTCPRLVTPGSPDAATPSRITGEACADDSMCISGICADDVCCESACRPSETCALEGARGTCTSRPIGETCNANEQCPAGHCVDGVCCESACDARCTFCASREVPGTCLPVADNQDPRNACGGACSACFGGACSPALAGTNPKEQCDDGQACDYGGLCRAAPGERCTADEDCAVGQCLAERCMARRLERVQLVDGNNDANEMFLLDTAVRRDGTPCMVVLELEVSRTAQTDGISYYLTTLSKTIRFACREQDGWRSRAVMEVPLVQSGGGVVSSSFDFRLYPAVHLVPVPSGMLMVVSNYDKFIEEDGLSGCDLVGYWFHPGNVRGGTRCIVDVPEAEGIWWFRVFSDALGVLHGVVAQNFGGSTLRLTTLACSEGVCELAGPSLAEDSMKTLPGTAVLVDGHVVAFDLSDDVTRLRALDAEGVVELPIDPACNVGLIDHEQDLPRHPVGAVALDGGVFVTLLCAGRVLTATYDTVQRQWRDVVVDTGGWTIYDAVPVRLSGGATATVVRYQDTLAMQWKRADGVIVERELNVTSDIGDWDNTAIAVTARDDFPIVWWEHLRRQAVLLPEDALWDTIDRFDRDIQMIDMAP